jgi:hypothetical protein
MSTDPLLLQLNPSGLAVINQLKQSPDESPESVIRRALALLRAVQKYIEDDALVVMDPNAPPNNDLVELVFDKVPADLDSRRQATH